MTDSEGGSTAASWLVIMNKSLADSEVHRLLLAQKHKIKVSTGTLPHTCIFPLSSAAFMILLAAETLTSWPPKGEQCTIDPTLSRRLAKFSELHHKCYVILTAPMLGCNEQKVLSELQRQYMRSALGFLVAHNSSECVECMSSIVKVTSKTMASVIRERIERVHRRLLSEEAVLATTQLCGVNRHAGTVLLDGCGSLAGVAKASSDTAQLMECSLDSNTAKVVKRYFSSE